ncbi:Erythromycin esterase [Penicillium cosmopolitanum]|uniref:Erythromycin esterase n=1 Tax=Penicillium cosmopolitanum TaxID=1131564 RepID=A0A9X0BDI2_9EURO|nr:Erythromycin esterase [Penicillium cosmopolitanum]KAJ5408584.1 Erythromycin esterase [Penicillium cosmopolitanum]
MTHLQELFNRAIQPLPAIDDDNFASHFDIFAGKQLVLLGDGSHGTSEFYSARAEITKRLIQKHGYTMVALEADWPDAEAIDRYVRMRPGPKAGVGGIAKGHEPFKRFPTWMWRNCEMQDLVEWVRDWNTRQPPENRAGFYGLDLYSMGASISAVIDYLDGIDPAAAKVARKRYSCLEPWVEDPTSYGLASLHGMKDCESEVINILRNLLNRRMDYIQKEVGGGEEEFQSGKQNAYLVRDAEKYYKAMYWSSATSWTMRDTHITDPRLRHKAIVWAHNSHVGDARYTSMGLRRNEVNIGQLCRERLGWENVCILGCGTHTGTVAAAHDWDEDMEVMDVNPSMAESWEMVAHETGVPSFLIDLRRGSIDRSLRAAMAAEEKIERFIGVIYRPNTERGSHYSHAFLHKQYDGYIWFDRTEAVKPLETIQPKTVLGKEETYPFGL